MAQFDPPNDIFHNGVQYNRAGAEVNSPYNNYVIPALIGGTSDAITISPVPAIASYVEGQEYIFDAKFTNTTAACTINISGLGALATFMGSVAMPAGDLVIGQLYRARVEGTGPFTVRIAPFDAVSSNGDRINGPLFISFSGTTQLTTTNTGAQATTGGSGYIGYHDAGAAMVSGNRLGFQLFGGATSAAHATANAVGMGGFATENWSGTNQGGNLQIYTTPNGSTTAARRTVATFGQDASFTPVGLIMPQQAHTASAPAYVKGGIYFDTTLNKLRVGGATAWETVTSV